MKICLEILSILDTELSGSSGSFIALVMHLQIFLMMWDIYQYISYLLHLQTEMSSVEVCFLPFNNPLFVLIKIKFHENLAFNYFLTFSSLSLDDGLGTCSSVKIVRCCVEDWCPCPPFWECPWCTSLSLNRSQICAGLGG